MAVSESARNVAGIRIPGRPDLLFVDAASVQVLTGDQVSVQTGAGLETGLIVMSSDQFAGDLKVVESALTGALELRDGQVFAVLVAEPTAPTARQIGAAIGGPPRNDRQSSLDDLHREYASAAPRLGSRMTVEGVVGTIVALDRERGIAVIELDSGEAVEVEYQAQ